MSEPEDIESGLEQMAFEVVDNGTLKLPLSTPACFAFQSQPKLAPERFEEELSEHEFSTLGTLTKESDTGFYYKTKVLTDHYKDCVVKVWKGRACIYPTDELLDTYEFSRIVHAIEDAFGAELKHEPKENNG